MDKQFHQTGNYVVWLLTHTLTLNEATIATGSHVMHNSSDCFHAIGIYCDTLFYGTLYVFMCLSSVTPNKKHQLNPRRFVSNATCIHSGSKNWSGNVDIDGRGQDCSNSIANALELQQSCYKPSIWYLIKYAHRLVVNYFLMIQVC